MRSEGKRKLQVSQAEEEALAEQPPACAPYLRPRSAPGWRRKGPSLEEQWVRGGVRIHFHWWSRREGFHQPLARRLDVENVQEREAERDRGLANGVYRLPFSQDPKELVAAGHMIMPAFFVDKESRRSVDAASWAAMSPENRIKHLRFVSNLKRLNRQCKKKSVKFEGLDKLPQMAGPGEFAAATSWDVNKAFNLLEIYRPDQKCMTLDLGQCVTGPRFVMCAAMPFGYVNSPYVFTRVMRVPVSEMRAEGIPTMIWLDDGLNLWRSAVEGKQRFPRVKQILEEFLGPGAVNEDKGEGWPEPVSVLQKHLGFRVDLQLGEYQRTDQTTNRLVKMAKQILRSAARHQRWVGALWIAQFAGLAISTMLATAQARFRCRPLHDFLVECQVHTRGWAPHVRGKLGRRQIRALEWWAGLKTRPAGRKIWRKPTTVVWATDASKRGHGGLTHARVLSQLPIGEEMGAVNLGLWSEAERQMSITALELRAFRIQLEKAASSAEAAGLLLLEDNMGVVHILSSFVTRSLEMEADLERIMELLEEHDIDLRVRWIPSAEMPADYFSREADKADWSLRRSVVAPLLSRWGNVVVDRFADRHNAVVPRFNSMYPSRGTECIDAFTAEWELPEGELNWLNPPWRKLGQVIAKLSASPRAEAVLLAPRWPTQVWYAALQRLADDVIPLHVPGTDIELAPDDFIPGQYLQMAGGVPEPLRNTGWALYAFHIPRRA